MLNLFRGRGQQQPQAKDNQHETQPLPETTLSDDALPSGIPAEGKAIVTISSQFGSGGSEIGRIVAHESGLLYLDHEIIGEVARRLGVGIEQAARRDEQTIGMARHVLEALQNNGPFAVNLDTILNPRRPSAQSQELVYWQLTRRVILELATAGDAVIIGRGSQFLLKDKPRTLHIYIFAPLNQRIENVMRHSQVERAQATRMVERRDYEHGAYLRRYYGSGQHYPELYHLLINTGLFPFELAADLIKQTLPLVKTFED
ncbi:MAG TPA: cytidylate kinase-like family protein [Ktedonobacteraceae bacterium]|nr:cytidylate kinase-like family protein [Ktedonobacteraceae bacterium]